MILKKIISGAQTGADRAALDVAIINRLPHGGWVPKGRKTEDYEKAMQWYHKAAEKGDASAQGLIGLLCAKGEGVKQDFVKALKWIELVKERGYTQAEMLYNILKERMTAAQIVEA